MLLQRSLSKQTPITLAFMTLVVSLLVAFSGSPAHARDFSSESNEVMTKLEMNASAESAAPVEGGTRALTGKAVLVILSCILLPLLVLLAFYCLGRCFLPSHRLRRPHAAHRRRR